MRKFEIRDKREAGFWQTDNEVLDYYPLSPLAFTLYSWLLRYAGNRTGAYFSIRKFAERYRKGKETVRDARDELIAHKLIANAGSDPKTGVVYFDLLPVPKGPGSVSDPPRVPTGPTPGSGADRALGLAQTPKNTDTRRLSKEDVHSLEPALPSALPVPSVIAKRKERKQPVRATSAGRLFDRFADYHRLIPGMGEIVNGSAARVMKTMKDLSEQFGEASVGQVLERAYYEARYPRTEAEKRREFSIGMIQSRFSAILKAGPVSDDEEEDRTENHMSEDDEE